MSIEWSYMRRGCKSCDKAKELLEKKRVTAQNEVDCKKQPIDEKALTAKLRELETVIVTKGKVAHRYSPSEDQAEILASAIGRSGNLRAPSLRHGNTLLVGFSEDIYPELVDELLLQKI